MIKIKDYQSPGVSLISLDLEGSVLSGSTLRDGTAAGENIIFGDEFDPWS